MVFSRTAAVPSPDDGEADSRPPAVSAYRAQVDSLADTYAQARTLNVEPLSAALESIRRRQTIFVGSGGALAVARLASDLQEARTHTLMRAATPLEFIGMPPIHDLAFMLFTASGRHPDAAVAAAAAIRMHTQPAVVVTHRTPEDLPPVFRSGGLEVVSLPPTARPEGFLATHSVLSMSATLIRATGLELPPDLPHLTRQQSSLLRDRVVVLSGPGLAAVAIDIETRLSETGLSSVQVTDYRNFAHGRHTGFNRRIADTTVLALVTPELRELAERTITTLPDTAHVLPLVSTLPWPLCVLDLLVGSMKTVATAAEPTGLDPARPTVPDFGRQLYHLSSRRWLPPHRSPVDRKIASAQVPQTQWIMARYAEALDAWLHSIHGQYFGGVVLDYDGTVCRTDERFVLPHDRVRANIINLLDAGLALGFASGRGGSLHRGLREWIPHRHWDDIDVGLYNGGAVLTLSEDLPDADAPSPLIDEAATRLAEHLFGHSATFAARTHQLSVEPARTSDLNTDTLASIVTETLARPPALPLKVVASAHSIDVVPEDSGKVRVVDRIRSRSGGPVLAIGDQGQFGGNDFDMLASSPWTLSVDRVSGDPTRCWNLDVRGERGPDLLRRYLAALRSTRYGVAFRWRP